MILVGIDDTDVLGARGTNRLARALVERLRPRWRCAFVLRHQLLVDPRIPYTSHNGSASILLEPCAEPEPGAADDAEIAACLRAGMLADFLEGSDPGLCVARAAPPPLRAFAERCRREVVTQDEARAVAAACGALLEGLGGTQAGVIGALAAVGLAASGDHGRVVVNGGHPDLSGVHDAADVLGHGVDAIVAAGGAQVASGRVDVGRHLRPSRRGGRTVLFVEPGDGVWRAVRAD